MYVRNPEYTRGCENVLEILRNFQTDLENSVKPYVFSTLQPALYIFLNKAIYSLVSIAILHTCCNQKIKQLLECFEHTSEHEELTAEPFTMVFCLFKLKRCLTVHIAK